MARQLIDLDELFSNEVSDQDYLLIRDTSGRVDKKITVEALRSAFSPKDMAVCNMWLEGNFAAPTNNTTIVPFNAVTVDTHEGFDLSGNRYVIPEDGAYFISLRGRVTTVTVTNEILYTMAIDINGIAYNSASLMTARNASPRFSASDIFDLKKGDSIRMTIYQNSGTDRTVTGDNSGMNGISIRRVS